MSVNASLTAQLAEGISSPLGTDLFQLSDRLGAPEKALIERVRSFVDTSVLPIINDYWERASFPSEILPSLASLGVIGSQITGHGCPGLTPLQAGLVTQELSRGDGSVNTFAGVQSNLAMSSIAMFGTEDQKSRWLPRMAALELIGAFALTEPGHGSDAAALETRAERQGDWWSISGDKRWIGNASMANIVVIFARDVSDSQVKAFVLERDPGHDFPAEFETQVITGKVGKRAILQPDIAIRGLRVSENNRLPGVHRFRDVARLLARSRAGASWEALGHALAAYEIAVRYAERRTQFGGPIGRFQLVQAKLADMLVELSAIQLMCFRSAELQESGGWTATMASAAKLYTASRARSVCQAARDLLGGNGLLLDFHVARHLTDMEVVHTYEGTEQVQQLLLGRAITGLSAFT